MKYFENWQISAGGRIQVNYRNVLLMLYFYFKKVKNKWKIKKMNKWKDHLQYLISFDLFLAKERLPNALNDACRLLFKEKTTIQSKMRTVYETSLLSLLRLFLVPSCKRKANENTHFGGRRLGNLLWRH